MNIKKLAAIAWLCIEIILIGEFVRNANVLFSLQSGLTRLMKYAESGVPSSMIGWGIDQVQGEISCQAYVFSYYMSSLLLWSLIPLVLIYPKKRTMLALLLIMVFQLFAVQSVIASEKYPYYYARVQFTPPSNMTWLGSSGYITVEKDLPNLPTCHQIGVAWLFCNWIAVGYITFDNGSNFIYADVMHDFNLTEMYGKEVQVGDKLFAEVLWGSPSKTTFFLIYRDTTGNIPLSDILFGQGGTYGSPPEIAFGSAGSNDDTSSVNTNFRNMSFATEGATWLWNTEHGFTVNVIETSPYGIKMINPYYNFDVTTDPTIYPRPWFFPERMV
jgi:hypothetical protein